MDRKGITLETIFRAKYNLAQVDIFALIQEAIMVASWEKPEEFLIGRSNLAEILFRKPREPYRFESDDESGEKDSTKTGLATIGDAITSKDNVCAAEKHPSCSDDNVNKKGRHIIWLKKRRKEVLGDVNKEPNQDMVQAKFEAHDIKKKLDQNMVQAKFETSVKKLKSRYRQVQENKRKIQVLDVKDLPPPKSRCNNIPCPKPCPKFSRQRSFRKPLCA